MALDPTALKAAIDDVVTNGDAFLTLKANPSTSTYDQVTAAYFAVNPLIDAVRAEFDAFMSQVNVQGAASLP